MKLTKKNAYLLQQLINGEVLSNGDFQNKDFLYSLIKSNIVNRKFITKTRYEVKLIDLAKLDLYLKKEYQIKSLTNYLNLFTKKNITRAEILSASNNDKLKSVNTLHGFYFASYDDITIKIGDENYNINTPNGSSLFINKCMNIIIPDNVLIVGVENAENLEFIQRQSFLFSSYTQKKLFVFRSPIMLEWVQNLKNEYLHFGDIDFAGISIYIHQIYPRLKSHSTFFIPKNIEEYLKNGNTSLYNNQLSYKKSILGFNEEIDLLIDQISSQEKGLAQEFFISD